MKKYILLAVAVFISTSLYAAEEQNKAAVAQKVPEQGSAAKKEQPASTPAKKKYTRSELITSINGILTKHPKVAATVRGVESVKQADGTSYYTFNGKKLDELDDDTLSELLSITKQMLTIERMRQIERQQKQLENIRQVERMNSMQRLIQQNNNQTPPRVYTPPKVPRTDK